MATSTSRTGDDAKRVQHWIRDGSGRGTAYTPWLTVQRVPSRGQANRVRGQKSGRTHHLLSTLETDALYVLDACDRVIDVREQYPLLPLDETLRIAEDLGVAHPTHPRTRASTVMTSDFLVTVAGPLGPTEEAISVKPSVELNDYRTLEKLEIERRYWQERQTPWGIVTERELRADLVHNLRWIAPMRDLSEFPLGPERIEAVLPLLFDRVRMNPRKPLSDVCTDLGQSLGLPEGAALSLVRYALATKRWRADLSVRIDPVRPLIGLVQVNVHREGFEA